MRLISSFLASAAMCATAVASPWTDPSQTLALDAPAGWAVAAAPVENLTYVVASAAGQECHIVGVPRAATAEASPQVIRIASLQDMNERAWMSVAGAFPDFFPGDIEIAERSVDTQNFWPVQRVTFNVADAPPVFAAIQFRPGLEMWALCRGGSDDTASTFDGLMSSIATPSDAALQQRAEADALASEEFERQARAFAIGERRIMTPVHERDNEGWIVAPGDRDIGGFDSPGGGSQPPA
jgi:hypothetical protein